MKKLFSILLGTLLLAGIFSGCTNTKTDNAEKAPETVSPVKNEQVTELPAENIQPEVPTESVDSVVTENVTDKPAPQAEKPVSSPSAQTTISKENAKEIALKHAGLAEKDVRFLKAELDRERNGLVYEVEFDSGKYEYDYEIDAETGKILKSEKEFID